MADYSTIKGFTIQSLSSDPYASEVLGGTWASGGNINTPRQQDVGAGTQTAGIIAGGDGVPGKNAETETYNGTAWTEVADLNSQRAGGGMASAGTTTATLYFCGQGWPPGTTLTSTESWNGTSWTEVAATGLTLGVSNTGTGTSTAAVVAGGDTGGGTTGAGLWDGTSWAATGAMNTARYQLGGCGTSTASIVFGDEPASAVTETFNGSTWTAVNSLNNARNAAAGFGTTTSAIAAGNLEPPSGVDVQTEAWDGSTWAAVPDLATGRWMAGAAGTGSAGFLAGGAIPAQTNVTEEWSVPSTVSVAQEGQVWYNTTSTVLKGYGQQGTGAWASGDALPVSIYSGMYCGIQTAGIYGGGLPGNLTTSYTYDGGSWTAAATMGTGRSNNNCAGCGTQTAGMVISGETASAPTYKTPNTEWFDGTSWTEKSNLINERSASVAAGDQAGALCISGAYPAGTTLVESWDGTSWTAGTAAPEAKWSLMGGGTQTSAITCGGQAAPPTTFTSADEWNGTSWTELAVLNQSRSYGGSAAPSGTSALVFGGSIPPRSAVTEQWNGTAWTEVADLATPCAKNTGNGTTGAALSIGNENPNNGAVEDWNIPSTTKTFSSS